MEMKSLTLNGTTYDSFNDKEAVTYEETKTIYLGENVLGTATCGTGWAEANGVYVHEKGTIDQTTKEYTNKDPLTFAITAEEGSIYLLEFDAYNQSGTSHVGSEFLRVGIGDQYQLLCYQGTVHITVPVLASGDNILYFTPVILATGTVAFSIRNITLRKIQDSGEEYTLTLYNTTTKNHTKNYGFWNTFIGDDVAENATGSTRCIGIGRHTLAALQGGHRNIAIGTFAMSQMIGGEENISIGADSMLAVQEAEGCIAIGMGAMHNAEEATENIAIGRNALCGATGATPSSNIAIGKYAGQNITSAKTNVFIGNNSGYNMSSGYCNTFIGESAAKAATTGYFNTAIGRNTVIPKDGRHCIVIGDGATAKNNYQMVLGSANVTEVVFCGNKKINFNDDGTVTWEPLTTS